MPYLKFLDSIQERLSGRQLEMCLEAQEDVCLVWRVDLGIIRRDGWLSEDRAGEKMERKEILRKTNISRGEHE